MATYAKTDSNELLKTTTKYNEDGATYEVTATYKRDFLENQVIAITEQRDEMIAAKQAELDEVNDLLAQCDTYGVTLPVEEEVTE